MIESLLCNSCGAPLEVPDSANYVTCRHCDTNLKIHREGAAASTEAIEKLAEETAGLAEKVDRLTKESQLSNLEKEWTNHERSFMVRDKYGGEHLPTLSLAPLVMGGFVVVFGAIWTTLAFAITRGAPNEGPFAVAKVAFPLFGIGFMCFGAFVGISSHLAIRRRLQDHAEAEREYLRRRREIEEGES